MKRTRLDAGQKSRDRGSTFAAPRKPLERKSSLERVSSSKSTTGGKGKAKTELRPRYGTPPMKRRKPISPASKEQREKCRDAACARCRRPGPCHPAHVVDRSLGGCSSPLCTVPLCPPCHREYDEGGLDLLPYLEPHYRPELAHAVEHVGLMATVRRVTNERTAA